MRKRKAVEPDGLDRVDSHVGLSFGFGATRIPCVRSLVSFLAAGLLWLALAGVLDERLGATVAGQVPMASGEETGGVTEGPGRVTPGRFLVRLRDGVAPAGWARGVLEQAPPGVHLRPLRTVSARPNRGMQPAGGGADGVWDRLWVAEVSGDGAARAWLGRVRASARVVYVEPSMRLQLLEEASTPVPNDFEYPGQWNLRNTGQDEGLVGADIHAQDGWSVTTGSRSVVVAVIDTGVDFLHPDLAANVWFQSGEIPGDGVDNDGDGFVDAVHGYDFVSGDGDPMDDSIHGTHVAGIIGAVGGNGMGVAGVCWEVSLMALKAFDETGQGDVADAIEALHFAVLHGARVVNASWGTRTRSRALEEAVQSALTAGVLVVAAAGNEGNDGLSFPAAFDGVVSVAATDRKDHRALFSRYGSTVDLAAPGEDILSTIPDNRYQALSGTSMATPQVSGAAALVFSRHPGFTPRQVADILKNTADPLDTDQSIGFGRLNLGKALRVDTPLPRAELRLATVVEGMMDVFGVAAGEGFRDYVLEYRSGSAEGVGAPWVELARGTVPVESGVLAAGVDTTRLREGPGVFRLTVWNTAGQASRAVVPVAVRNIRIRSPDNNDILALGTLIPVMGSVAGSGASYRLEWGAGREPVDWVRTGLRLSGAGAVTNGVLGTWDTSVVPAGQSVVLRLVGRTLEAGEVDWRIPFLWLDGALKPGFPVRLSNPVDLSMAEWRGFAVADLNGDGRKQIIRVDPGDGGSGPARLRVLDARGVELWSRDLGVGEPRVDEPVVGDLDGDGLPEIVVEAGSDHRVRVFRRDGSEWGGGWPLVVEAGGLGKVIADVDGDGRPELITLSTETIPGERESYRQLSVFRSDGSLAGSWRIPGCDSTGDVDVPRQLPVVARLDRGRGLKIVAPYACDSVAAFSLENQAGPVWIARADGAIVSSPVAVDLNGDGLDEVVVSVLDIYKTVHGGVYAFDGSGHVLAGWPVLQRESFAASPAIGDVDGDGAPELCLPSWSAQTLHVLRTNGFELEGWPVAPGGQTTTRSLVTIGDVDGDGRPDVVLVSPGSTMLAVWRDEPDRMGGVKAWSAGGQPVALGGTNGPGFLPMEFAGGESRMKSIGAWIGDLDGDGVLDLVAATVFEAGYQPGGPPSRSKQRGSMHAWTLGVPVDPEFQPWSAPHGAAHHNGRYVRPPHRNRPPVVSGIPDQVAADGASFIPLALDGYVLDPDHTPREMRWTAVSSDPSHLRVRVDADRVFRVEVVDPVWTGSVRVRLTAVDPGGEAGEQDIRLEVRPGYRPPVAGADVVEMDEDTQAEFSPLSNDLDPEGLRLRLLGFSRASKGQVERLPGDRLRYIPDPDANGGDQVTYSISNDQGGLAIGVVTFKIRPVNDPPRARMDTVILDEDTVAVVDVLANDTDVDGDPISLVRVEDPAHGTVEVGPGGKVVYRPLPDYNGDDRFQYVIADPAGLMATGAVVVVVRPVNDLPTVEPQAFSLRRNTSQGFSLLGHDVDGDALSYRILKGPDHGQIFLYPTVATYTPQKGYSGPDSLTYVANDGVGDGVPAVVSFEVRSENNPPEAQTRSWVTRRNQPLAIRLTAVDLDGDPLTFQVRSLPGHGELSGAGTNYVYVPARDYLGDDAFTFQVSDGKDESAPGRIHLRVTDENTAPVARSGSASTKMDQALSLEVDAEDAEGTALQFKVVEGPIHGRLDGVGPRFTYVPALHFVGGDRFSFKVSDGELESGVATFVIEVRPLNSVPVATNQSVVAVQGRPLQFGLRVTDADGDALTTVILKGPRHGRVFGAGTNWTYSPNPGYSGSDLFTYRSWDGHAYSRETQVLVQVQGTGPDAGFGIREIGASTGGMIELLMVADSAFSLESSTNLVDWVPLAKLQPMGPTTRFSDTNASGLSARFYRLRR